MDGSDTMLNIIVDIDGSEGSTAGMPYFMIVNGNTDVPLKYTSTFVTIIFVNLLTYY